MKRKFRHSQIKRWTQDEISKIVDYMTEYKNVEKPTARVYYEEFLKISPIDASWDLIKWKVRHLKTLYAKAEKWKNTKDAKSLDAQRFAAKLQRMCPHFYRLQKIFDENRAEVVEILDSNSSFDDCYGYNDEFEETFDNQCEFKLFENNNNEAANVHCEQIVDDTKTNADLSHAEEAEKCETMQISTHFTSVPVNVLNEQTNEDIEFVETAPPIVDTIDLRSIAKKIKKEKIRKSLAALTQSQVDKNEMQKLRFKFEEYKFAQEFEFIKYKFEAEVELKKQELELREREMESNQRLRILEIESNQNLKTMEMEKNERVAKYELNLKYNALHKNTCNKNSD